LFLETGRRRKLVLIGPWEEASLPGDVRALQPTVLRTRMESVADIAAALRALVRGRPVQAPFIGGIPIGELKAVCAEFRAAHYLVFAWSAAEFDFPHADL